MWAPVRFLLAAAAAAVLLVEAAVLELDESSFDRAIASSRYILVDFYAPWCGHCKALSPELDRVAASFPEPEMAFAKVDADKFRNIASKHEIGAYPTLKLFVDGVPTEYTGSSYKAEHMVPILKRMMAPELVHLDCGSALLHFLSNAGTDLPVFVAFGLDDPQLGQLAGSYKLRAWFATMPADAELLTSYGITGPPALLVRHGPEAKRVFYGQGGPEMAAFVKHNLLPPVTQLSHDNLEHVKEDGRPILVCIWNRDSVRADFLNDFDALAQVHTKLVFASLDASMSAALADMFNYNNKQSFKLLVWTGGSEYHTILDEQPDLAAHVAKLVEDSREGRAEKHLIKGPSLKEQLFDFARQNLIYLLLFFVTVAGMLQGMDWKGPRHATHE